MDFKSVAKFWAALDVMHKVFLFVALASIMCTIFTDCIVCKYWPVTFNVRNPMRALEHFESPAPAVSLVLYTASWCPHCQAFDASGEWEKTKQALAGTPIIVEKLDADADADKVKAAGVDSYPSIVFYKDGKSVKYEGERKADSIVKFVQMQ